MKAFVKTIEPRFAETDALGHINHTVVPVWFEQARTPIFEMFNPGQDLKVWNLILKRIDVDYVGQIFLGSDVTIHTTLKSLGNSSLVIHHEARQNERVVAQGDVVLVYFNYEAQTKATIPDEIREKITPYLHTQS